MKLDVEIPQRVARAGEQLSDSRRRVQSHPPIGGAPSDLGMTFRQHSERTATRFTSCTVHPPN
ncbi:hypothetical protein GCM10022295_81260 [Streptomyces osmaniensis]|uniref:Uncharacterized protein n=1 Tax=Streptomyces osmaniensis TaxID=593134 RepID=A0ABP6YSD1_9ACTN